MFIHSPLPFLSLLTNMKHIDSGNVLDSMWGHTWVNNTICWYFTCFLFGGTSFLQDGGQEPILRHQIGWLLSVCLFTFPFYPFPPYTLSWYASMTPGRTLYPLVSGYCSVNENRQNIWESEVWVFISWLPSSGSLLAECNLLKLQFCSGGPPDSPLCFWISAMTPSSYSSSLQRHLLLLLASEYC